MTDVLVTGASSPLGDHVLPALLAAYPRVAATARSADTAARLARAGAQVVRLDLADYPPVVQTRAPMVVHLAGIRLARSAAALARAVGAETLVAVSSASAVVAGHPARDSVLRGEEELLRAVPSACVLRPTMIYGSARDRNVRRLYRFSERLRRVPRVSGGGRIMPVLVDDVATALLEVLAAPPAEVRPVGGPAAIRFSDLLDEICHAARLRRLAVRVPLEVLVRLARLRGAGAGQTVHALQMLGVDRLVESPAEAGFRYPPTSLRDGMARAMRRYDLRGNG